MFLTVNRDGTELAWNNTGRFSKPHRDFYTKKWYYSRDENTPPVRLPKGTIKALTGKDMSWQDDAIVVEELPYKE